MRKSSSRDRVEKASQIFDPKESLKIQPIALNLANKFKSSMARPKEEEVVRELRESQKLRSPSPKNSSKRKTVELVSNFLDSPADLLKLQQKEPSKVLSAEQNPPPVKKQDEFERAKFQDYYVGQKQQPREYRALEEQQEFRRYDSKGMMLHSQGRSDNLRPSRVKTQAGIPDFGRINSIVNTTFIQPQVQRNAEFRAGQSQQQVDLPAKLRTLQAKLARERKATEQCRRKARQISEELMNAKRIKRNLENEREKMRAQQTEANGKEGQSIQRLLKQRNELQQKIKKQKERRKGLNSNNDSFSIDNQLDELKSELANKTSELGDKEQKLQELKRQKAKMVEQVSQLQEEIEQQKKRIQEQLLEQNEMKKELELVKRKLAKGKY